MSLKVFLYWILWPAVCYGFAYDLLHSLPLGKVALAILAVAIGSKLQDYGDVLRFVEKVTNDIRRSS